VVLLKETLLKYNQLNYLFTVTHLYMHIPVEREINGFRVRKDDIPRLFSYLHSCCHTVFVSCMKRLRSNETAVKINRCMHYNMPAAYGRLAVNPKMEKWRILQRRKEILHKNCIMEHYMNIICLWKKDISKKLWPN
jgi:hypothetical protein